MSDKKIVMNLEAIMGDRFGKYSKYIIRRTRQNICYIKSNTAIDKLHNAF